MDSTAPPLTADAARARMRADLDAIDAAHDRLRALSTDLVGNAFRVEVARHLEAQGRTNRGLSYRMFAEMADQRIICHARDVGCTRSNCFAPGYDCEVHHAGTRST
jgi:hypothetical protein